MKFTDHAKRKGSNCYEDMSTGDEYNCYEIKTIIAYNVG